jgi:hypothetical protein
MHPPDITWAVVQPLNSNYEHVWTPQYVSPEDFPAGILPLQDFEPLY